MRQRLAWNSGKPHRPSYQPVSISWHTLVTMGTPQFHAKRCFISLPFLCTVLSRWNCHFLARPVNYTRSVHIRFCFQSMDRLQDGLIQPLHITIPQSINQLQDWYDKPLHIRVPQSINRLQDGMINLCTWEFRISLVPRPESNHMEPHQTKCAHLLG